MGKSVLGDAGGKGPGGSRAILGEDAEMGRLAASKSLKSKGKQSRKGEPFILQVAGSGGKGVEK